MQWVGTRDNRIPPRVAKRGGTSEVSTVQTCPAFCRERLQSHNLFQGRRHDDFIISLEQVERGTAVCPLIKLGERYFDAILFGAQCMSVTIYTVPEVWHITDYHSNGTGGWCAIYPCVKPY